MFILYYVSSFTIFNEKKFGTKIGFKANHSLNDKNFIFKK